jgi:hypothetical protein
MDESKKIEKCPITGDTERVTYFDLGLMPLVNNLCSSKEESLNCIKYPLAVQLFTKSGLSTLTTEINPNLLYEHYLYKSGVSQPYIEHCEEMFNFLNVYLNLKDGDAILDIGGNDGTLLKTFLQKNAKLNVLNIDASKNLTDESEKSGIPSLNAFWNVDLAKKLNKKFKLITTTNCFQHTAPIESFVEGISISLDKFGIWCLEFPYWKTSIQTNQFDQVYHEHIYYYLVKPINDLVSKYNLQIIKAVEYSIHGGTMRLLISHKGELGSAWQQCQYSVIPKINGEHFTVNDYIDWGKTLKNSFKKSKDFLIDLKNQGYKIAGFGAAAKGCVYLNAAKIDFNQIDYVMDDTFIKQGKFIPGTGIEIVSRNELKTNKVDYIIILAHNFTDYIIKLLRYDGYTGKFIIFLPDIKII